MLVQASQEVISECLDIMAEVLLRFGRSLKDEHLFLKDILLQYVADSRSVIRKRAVSCIGELHVLQWMAMANNEASEA